MHFNKIAHFYFLSGLIGLAFQNPETHSSVLPLENIWELSDANPTEKFATDGPYMSSKTFEKNVKAGDFTAIIERICLPVEQDESCDQDLTDFENQIISDTNKNFKVIKGGSFGTIYKISDQEIKKVISVDSLEPLIFALQEINISNKMELSRQKRIVDNLLWTTDCCSEIKEVSDGVITKRTIKFYLTQPFMLNGNLRQFMYNPQNLKATTDFDWKLKILIGIAQAVKFLHNENYIHRDLKPENVFLDSENRPMLSDFNFAKNLDSIDAQSVGTPLYMAPEVEKKIQQSDLKADVFSFGILMFEVFNVNNYRLTANIKSDILDHCPMEDPLKILEAQNFQDFEKAIYCRYFHKIVLAAISQNPKDRPLISEILRFLQNEENKFERQRGAVLRIFPCDNLDLLKESFDKIIQGKILEWKDWGILAEYEYCNWVAKELKGQLLRI